MKKFLKNAPNATTSTGPTVDVNMVLTVPAYGERYHVKKHTVWSWVRIGLPHLKLSPRKTVIPAVEADRWMVQRFYRQRQPR